MGAPFQVCESDLCVVGGAEQEVRRSRESEADSTVRGGSEESGGPDPAPEGRVSWRVKGCATPEVKPTTDGTLTFGDTRLGRSGGGDGCGV